MRTFKKIANYFEKHSIDFTCAMASINSDVAEICEMCRK